MGASRARESRLLTVLGAINWDISIFEERFARQGEEVPVRLVEEFSGGKGANVAVSAARILGRDHVAFIGALGGDEIARRQIRELNSEHVLTQGVIKIKGSQSGRAYVVIDGAGKKTIHTHFGANEKITAEDLDDRRIASIIRQSRMVIIMDSPREVAERAATTAKRCGATVLYSPGVRTQEGIQALDAILDETDYLVLDRIELRNLCADTDENAMVRRTVNSHPRLTVIATLSERGCLVGRESGARIVGGVDLSLLGRKVVNTTGCGDAFLGAFASYLLMGASPLDAVSWANLAGALKATRYETRGGPTRAELETEMRRLEKIRQSQLGLQSSKVF